MYRTARWVKWDWPPSHCHHTVSTLGYRRTQRDKECWDPYNPDLAWCHHSRRAPSLGVKSSRFHIRFHKGQAFWHPYLAPCLNRHRFRGPFARSHHRFGMWLGARQADKGSDKLRCCIHRHRHLLHHRIHRRCFHSSSRTCHRLPPHSISFASRNRSWGHRSEQT